MPFSKCAPTFPFKPHEVGPHCLVVKDRLFNDGAFACCATLSGSSVTHLGGMKSIGDHRRKRAWRSLTVARLPALG